MTTETPTRPASPLMLAAPAIVTLALVFALALVGTGGTAGAVDVVLAAGESLLMGAWPALAILAGACGYGVLARPILRGTAREVEPIFGLSIFLTASHALGWLGLSAGSSRQLVVLALVGVGLCVFVADRVREWKRTGWVDEPVPGEVRLPRWVSLTLNASFVIASAVLVVAALSPPGWLWSSEFGGYDALSYHLQLPQEWLRLGKLGPLDHNVYSFLPSSVESVYLLIAALTGAPAAPGAGSHAFGLAAGIAQGAIACQLLHAGMAIWSARALTALAKRIAPAGSALAGPLLISIPWVVVVGSLAYNEMPLLLLLIGAISCAADNADGSLKRAAICAWLVGIAVSVKPTAIMLAAPGAGITLLVFTPWKRWPAVLLVGAVVGAVSLLPWMARNFHAAGNPVFPALADYFTSGPWTQEQLERFARAHRFSGSLSDRLALTILPDATDPAGARHRGLLHPQWAVLFPGAMVALGVLLATLRGASANVKRWAVVLVLALASQLIAWLFFTHIQARFLLPIAPVAVLAIVVLADSLSRGPERGRGLRVVVWLATLLSLGHAGWSAYLFTRERAGHPNTALVIGAGAFTGESLRGQLPNLPQAQRDEVLNQVPPEAFINLTLPHDARVWLLGDATPFYLGCDVTYNTTYDLSLLTAAVDRYGDNPTGWARFLKAQKIEYVLVNFGELDRLVRSGFAEASVTPENANKLVVSWGSIVRAWPEQGRALYKLRVPPPPSPSELPSESSSSPGANEEPAAPSDSREPTPEQPSTPNDMPDQGGPS
ncbi:MAG: hypothetical protein JNL50_09700 [Phycisphaerae bacterium]|nr:hypothetical protein [Phycisphaerae bacterium]